MPFKHKATQRDQSAFDMASCMAMMEKMRSGHSVGCDCEEMMSQINSEGGIPDEWIKVMSQMMGAHCGPQEDAERKSKES